jgi:hypothetical protein
MCVTVNSNRTYRIVSKRNSRHNRSSNNIKVDSGVCNEYTHISPKIVVFTFGDNLGMVVSSLFIPPLPHAHILTRPWPNHTLTIEAHDILVLEQK